MAKLLGTNVGTIQQDLSILLKDESIEVCIKPVYFNFQNVKCSLRGTLLCWHPVPAMCFHSVYVRVFNALILRDCFRSLKNARRKTTK